MVEDNNRFLYREVVALRVEDFVIERDVFVGRLQEPTLLIKLDVFRFRPGRAEWGEIMSTTLNPGRYSSLSQICAYLGGENSYSGYVGKLGSSVGTTAISCSVAEPEEGI